MIAGVGAVVIVLALTGVGVLWGLVRLAGLAAGVLQRGVSGRLGPTMGQAGAMGVGWGVSKFAGRFATPILLWALLLALGAVVVAVLTWRAPHTLVGVAVGVAIAIFLSRGIPRVIERMIKRRLAKGLLRR